MNFVRSTNPFPAVAGNAFPKPRLIRLEILMTDDARGTLHGLLHVRAPEDIRISLVLTRDLPNTQAIT